MLSCRKYRACILPACHFNHVNIPLTPRAPPPTSQLGFGTWQSAPGQVGEAVYQALKAGYRHLDLATIYQNQREVAAGIKRAYQDVPGLKREDLFITSKLWNTQHRPQDVEKALDECLAELELDYLDVRLSPSLSCPTMRELVFYWN